MTTSDLGVLLKFADAIANATGGLTAIFDSEGKLFQKGQGPEQPENLTTLRCFSEIITQKPVKNADAFKSPRGDNVWVLRIGEYYLVSLISYKKREKIHIKDVYLKALPLIAKVAGGEAILFDTNGIIFESVCPDGKGIRQRGTYSLFGHKAMQTSTPSFGPSILEEGAIAVRIPINEEFGLAFNNFISIKQKRSLVQSKTGYTRYTISNIVGESPAIRISKERALKVAVSDSTILIYGETGTGKELFAQAMHNASNRAGGPFIALNCSALPASLTESILFGYESGAFTGARREGQQGLFEQANKGTLFLDDISDMDLSVQSRFLRVLQEREVCRVGGKKHVPVDVRIIASSNRNLREMVDQKAFRLDLFYRLNVVDLQLPPLSDRLEDIPVLCRAFIAECKKRFHSPVRDISDEAILCLQNYNWPGNVRELYNVIERAMNLSVNEFISIEDLPASIARSSPDCYDPICVSAVMPKNNQLDERNKVLFALEQKGNSRRRAAESLGISTVTLWRKMKKLGIPVRPVSVL